MGLMTRVKVQQPLAFAGAANSNSGTNSILLLDNYLNLM